MGQDPQHFSVFAVDIQRYSARDDEGQVELRRELRRLQRIAAEQARLRLIEWHRHDTGDGVVALIPAAVPKARLVAELVRELRIALRRVNQPRRDDERIRLRVALHHGDVYRERTGFPGATVVDTCRLLDAAPLRQALDFNPEADVAVILSDRMFKDVDGKRDIHRRDYRAVAVTVKDFTASAWITIPGFPPANPSAAPNSAVADSDSTSKHDHAADRAGKDDDRRGDRKRESEPAATRRLDAKRSTFHGQVVLGDSQIAGRDINNS